ncbi:hypothetical protein ACFY05_32940 [Microtetraspora fusca]|uniref:Uncharacterized protein n=1 Tax=Microtetraspora fusca TaxID=1997 RepID=A0ABW6VEV1_MICFU
MTTFSIPNPSGKGTVSVGIHYVQRAGGGWWVVKVDTFRTLGRILPAVVGSGWCAWASPGAFLQVEAATSPEQWVLSEVHNPPTKAARETQAVLAAASALQGSPWSATEVLSVPDPDVVPVELYADMLAQTPNRRAATARILDHLVEHRAAALGYSAA